MSNPADELHARQQRLIFPAGADAMAYSRTREVKIWAVDVQGGSGMPARVPAEGLRARAHCDRGGGCGSAGDLPCPAAQGAVSRSTGGAARAGVRADVGISNKRDAQ